MEKSFKILKKCYRKMRKMKFTMTVRVFRLLKFYLEPQRRLIKVIFGLLVAFSTTWLQGISPSRMTVRLEL